MRLKELHIEGFRSIKSLDMAFCQDITVVLGENNTGKTTIGTAIQRLLGPRATGASEFIGSDYPYDEPCQIKIDLTLDLSDAELESLLIAPLTPVQLRGQGTEALANWRAWLLTRGRSVTISLRHNPGDNIPSMVWGDLEINRNTIRSTGAVSGDAGPWAGFAKRVVQLIGKESDIKYELEQKKWTVDGEDALQRPVINDAAERFKLFPELRTRVDMDTRRSHVESLGGEALGSVLLNLRIHPEEQQRHRFDLIEDTFTKLFPRYDRLVATEATPGAGQPLVQIREKGTSRFLSLNHLSAGTHQMLAIIANVVGRRGLFLWVEHPESSLHPHGARALRSLLSDGVATNDTQVVVVTHDPQFLDPASPEQIRRVWWTPNHGTKVGEAPRLTPADKGRLVTSLRNTEDRDVLFARAVVLVEDESQLGFLQSVATKLKFDLDGHSISIIAVHGHASFRPYITLLNSLGIPHVCLRDKTWGKNPAYPKDRFFSLGAELEQYMDDQGFKELREQVEREVGTSKRRAASRMASLLDVAKIPDLFGRVLQAALDMATGEPSQS